MITYKVVVLSFLVVSFSWSVNDKFRVVIIK